MERQGFEADCLHVNLFNRLDKTTTPPTTSWDRSVDGVLWSPDSQFLIADASDRAKHKLWQISVPSGQVSELASVRHNMAPGWVSPDTLLYLRDSMLSPVDIWGLRLDTMHSEWLTAINRELEDEQIEKQEEEEELETFKGKT